VLVKNPPIFGQFINVGGHYFGAVVPDIVPAEVIGNDKKNIWPIRLFRKNPTSI